MYYSLVESDVEPPPMAGAAATEGKRALRGERAVFQPELPHVAPSDVPLSAMRLHRHGCCVSSVTSKKVSPYARFR